MIGVLVSGRGTNLRALLDAGLPVTAVASNRADAAALAHAQEAGIATAVFELEGYGAREERDAALAGWLAQRGVALVVLAGYMHLLTRPFLERFADRILNVHPALLPAFPGGRAVADALAYGVRWSGATVHCVDEGVDTGRIVLQEPVAVEPDDTPETLHARIQAVEHRLLREAVRLFLAGRLRLPAGSRQVIVE
jgi:phosphoribosylglycinamide formyltransferase-1